MKILFIFLISITTLQCSSAKYWAKLDYLKPDPKTGKLISSNEALYPLKVNSSIAIICATDNEMNADVAIRLESELKQKANLKIVSQSEIKKIIPSYPQTILDQSMLMTDSKRETSDPYVSEITMGLIKQYFQLLKTDYIYFVWLENQGSVQGAASYVKANVGGRLIDKNLKVIGVTCYQRTKSYSYSPFSSKSLEESLDKMLDSIAQDISYDLSKKGGILKQNIIEKK